ncbi:MAG: NAD(P)/FAD-dependent oxidoreductase [Chitinophagales bacterium]
MPTTKTPNLIIGAGPAGLAVAGRLRKMNIPFEVVEQKDKIAWSWTNHYDRLHLHTVKQLSALPHLPFPKEYPTYVPRLDLVKYYETYAQTFDIQPHFNTSVTSIRQKANNHWLVETNTEKSFEVENVVIATGINRIPNFPTWKGQKSYQGQIVHSRNYKNPAPFAGQKVLVVGMGNTGAEVALDLSEKGIDTYISVRSPINFVPRDVNGRPVQLTAKQLAKLPFGLGDWLGMQIRKIVIGDLTKYGIPMSKMNPTVQLTTTGKTPVIDIGTVAQVKAGKIKVLPDIDYFYETGIAFKNGERHGFNAVIACTGYRSQLEDFLETTDGLLDKYDVPKQVVGIGDFEGLYFVGYDNYKLGGILGTIVTDSETVAEAIKGSQND